jgi:hypothetical protein
MINILSLKKKKAAEAAEGGGAAGAGGRVGCVVCLQVCARLMPAPRLYSVTRPPTSSQHVYDH